MNGKVNLRTYRYPTFRCPAPVLPARAYTSMVLSALPCRLSALTCLAYKESNLTCCDLFIAHSSSDHASDEAREGIICSAFYLPRSGFALFRSGLRGALYRLTLQAFHRGGCVNG